MSDESNDPQSPREAARQPFEAEVSLRRPGGHAFRVRAFDISPGGCKIEFVERPTVGERVWIKFDSFEALGASVRWIDGPYGGVEFDRALYPAVFDRIAR